MELNSAVRPCKLKKPGANAMELLVCFLSFSGTLGAMRSRTVRAQLHFLSLLPYSSTPVFHVFCLLSFLLCGTFLLIPAYFLEVVGR